MKRVLLLLALPALGCASVPEGVAELTTGAQPVAGQCRQMVMIPLSLPTPGTILRNDTLFVTTGVELPAARVCFRGDSARRGADDQRRSS